LDIQVPIQAGVPMSIEGLNLSLSALCPASCVFCPTERGTRDACFMEPSLVVKLVEEASSPDFPWKVKQVQTGENGEASCSPFLLDNLRTIRKYLPRAKVNLTSNLYSLTQRQAESIMRERLLDSLQLNIDGHNAETYEAQKGISYKRVMGNLRMLLHERKTHHPSFSVGINVLTLHDYCVRAKKRFGQTPMNAPEEIPFSSHELVEKSLRKQKWMTDDIHIRKSPSFFWAERGMDVDAVNDCCPQLPRILKEAFISPSGLWYPCCLDSNQDQAYGSVKENTLQEIHDSEARQKFIQRLQAGEFEEIGYPCNRSAFCKGMK